MLKVRCLECKWECTPQQAKAVQYEGEEDDTPQESGLFVQECRCGAIRVRADGPNIAVYGSHDPTTQAKRFQVFDPIQEAREKAANGE